MTPGFDLQGRGALITVGSTGLGEAMARGVAHQGAGHDRPSRNGDELRDDLRHTPEGRGGRGDCEPRRKSRGVPARRAAADEGDLGVVGGIFFDETLHLGDRLLAVNRWRNAQR